MISREGAPYFNRRREALSCCRWPPFVCRFHVFRFSWDFTWFRRPRLLSFSGGYFKAQLSYLFHALSQAFPKFQSFANFPFFRFSKFQSFSNFPMVSFLKVSQSFSNFPSSSFLKLSNCFIPFIRVSQAFSKFHDFFVSAFLDRGKVFFARFSWHVETTLQEKAGFFPRQLHWSKSQIYKDCLLVFFI